MRSLLRVTACTRRPIDGSDNQHWYCNMTATVTNRNAARWVLARLLLLLAMPLLGLSACNSPPTINTGERQLWGLPSSGAYSSELWGVSRAGYFSPASPRGP